MESIKRVEGADLVEVTDKDGQKFQLSAQTLREFQHQSLPLNQRQERVVSTAAKCYQVIMESDMAFDPDSWQNVISALQVLLRTY